MDRPPLPLPRPGEAIIATALAGALGLTTWACVTFFAFPEYTDSFVPAHLAVPLAPLAFHWLRYALVTANNSPERGIAPTTSTAVRVCGRAFVYAPVVAGLCFAGRALAARLGVYVSVVLYPVGIALGIPYWVPAAVFAILTYGLPLRAATGAMDAAYPDVVDRGLVRTHARLAIGAALALIVGGVVGGVGFARADVSPLVAQISFATFLLLGLLAVAVPVGVALRAQRRLAARKAWPTGDLELVPIAEQEAERLARVPILGDGTAPTHALVRARVAGAENYRIAATAEEPLALVAVEDEDADRASLRSR